MVQKLYADGGLIGRDNPSYYGGTWAYHHKDTMDAARYQEMLSRNKELEIRIKLLESQGVRADPTFVPEGLDADLQYSDEYVDAIVNPQAETKSESHVVGMVFGVFLLLVLATVIVLAIIAIWVRWHQ